MKREEIIAALEHVSSKLKPLKMEKSEIYDDLFKCPICKRLYPKSFFAEYEVKYCLHCGQRIKM